MSLAGVEWEGEKASWGGGRGIDQVDWWEEEFPVRGEGAAGDFNC